MQPSKVDVDFQRQTLAGSLTNLLAPLSCPFLASLSVAWRLVTANASLIELASIGLVDGFPESLKD
jgi:hypothetical protein